jgi:hypothetical protein
MRKVLLPSGVSGSSKDYPYLARFDSRFKHYSTIILLVTKKKQTVLLGRYTGQRYNVTPAYYTPGYTITDDDMVPETYLLPLNRGRL